MQEDLILARCMGWEWRLKSATVSWHLCAAPAWEKGTLSSVGIGCGLARLEEDDDGSIGRVGC